MDRIRKVCHVVSDIQQKVQFGTLKEEKKYGVRTIVLNDALVLSFTSPSSLYWSCQYDESLEWSWRYSTQRSNALRTRAVPTKTAANFPLSSQKLRPYDSYHSSISNVFWQTSCTVSFQAQSKFEATKTGRCARFLHLTAVKRYSPLAKRVESWYEDGCAFNYGIVWGSHAHLFSTSCAPKRVHNWARAYSRPRFPLFLKVRSFIQTLFLVIMAIVLTEFECSNKCKTLHFIKQHLTLIPFNKKACLPCDHQIFSTWIVRGTVLVVVQFVWWNINDLTDTGLFLSWIHGSV